MFANLKNKLIEEVKASPSKFQQFANAAQVMNDDDEQRKKTKFFWNIMIKINNVAVNRKKDKKYFIMS